MDRGLCTLLSSPGQYRTKTAKEEAEQQNKMKESPQFALERDFVHAALHIAHGAAI